MTPDEKLYFDMALDEARRLFGPLSRVYYSSEPDDHGLYEVFVCPQPFPGEHEGPGRILSTSLELKTTGTESRWALKDMAGVLGRLGRGKSHPFQTWPKAARAKLRPENFPALSPAEQWAIDKYLGILDWDGGDDDLVALRERGGIG